MQSPASISALLRRFREEPPKPPSQRKAAPVDAGSRLSADDGSQAPTAVRHARTHTHTPTHTEVDGRAAARATTSPSSTPPPISSPSLRHADDAGDSDDTQRVLERARAVIASSRKMFEAGVIPGLEAMAAMPVMTPGRGGDRQREAGRIGGTDAMSSSGDVTSGLRWSGGDSSGSACSAGAPAQSASVAATQLSPAVLGPSSAPMLLSSVGKDAGALWRVSEGALPRAHAAAESPALLPDSSMQLSASIVLPRGSIDSFCSAEDSSTRTGTTRRPPDADILASLGDSEWKQRLLAGAHIGAVATDSHEQREPAPDDASAASLHKMSLQSRAAVSQNRHKLPRQDPADESGRDSAATQRTPSPLHAVAMAIQQVSQPLIPEITLPTDFIIPHAHGHASEINTALPMGAPMGSTTGSTLGNSARTEHYLYPDVATIELEDPEITIQRLRQRLARIDEESGLYAAAAQRPVVSVPPMHSRLDQAPGAHAQPLPYAYVATAVPAAVDSGHWHMSAHGHVTQSVHTMMNARESEVAERRHVGDAPGSSASTTRRADACVGTESPVPWAMPPVASPVIDASAEIAARRHGDRMQPNATAPKLGAPDDVQTPKSDASADVSPAPAPHAAPAQSTGAAGAAPAVAAAPPPQTPSGSTASTEGTQTDACKPAQHVVDHRDGMDADNRVVRRDAARSSLRDSVALSLDSLDWHLSDEDEPVLRQSTKLAAPIPDDHSSSSGPDSSPRTRYEPSTEDEQGTEPLPSSISAVAASSDNFSAVFSGAPHTPAQRTIEASLSPAARSHSLHPESRSESVVLVSMAHPGTSAEQKDNSGQHPRMVPGDTVFHGDVGSAAAGLHQHHIVAVDTNPPLQVRAASPSSRGTDSEKPHTVVLVVTSKHELADVLSTLGVASAPLEQSTVAAPSIAEVSVHTDDSAAQARHAAIRRLEPRIQRMPAIHAQAGTSRPARSALAAISPEEQHLLNLLDDDPLYHQLLREAQRRRTGIHTHTGIVSHS